MNACHPGLICGLLFAALAAGQEHKGRIAPAAESRDPAAAQKVADAPVIPALQLKGPMRFDERLPKKATPAPRAPRVPFGATDLLAPAETRERVVADFLSREADAERRLKKRPVVPLAPTDLIGPDSDREKLIEFFRANETRPPR